MKRINNVILSNRIRAWECDDPNIIKIEDELKGTIHYVDLDDLQFALSLDGNTSPYSLLPDLDKKVVDGYMNYLKQNDLIRTDRLLSHFNLIHLYKGLLIPTLYPFSEMTKEFIRKLISLLLKSFPFMCILAVEIFSHIDISKIIQASTSFCVVGLLLCIWLSGIISTISKILTGIAYNARIIEIGIKILPFPGVFVFMDESTFSVRQKLHYCLLDVEANILLSGILLIIGTVTHNSSAIWHIATLNALICAIVCGVIDGPISCLIDKIQSLKERSNNRNDHSRR